MGDIETTIAEVLWLDAKMVGQCVRGITCDPRDVNALAFMAPELAAEVTRLRAALATMTAEHDHDHEAAGLANAEAVRLAAECERAQRDEHAAIIDRDGALLRLAVKQERADELADCLRDTDALVDLYLHATCNGRIETIVDACRKKWSALRAALETP